ncbi:uncharacterized protein LOC6566034 isoform X2 [Drosophila grimshawi]|nr:uncharacterized protein LOC6566034 isoform X2 [Drosophila grimshawi]
MNSTSTDISKKRSSRSKSRSRNTSEDTSSSSDWVDSSGSNDSCKRIRKRDDALLGWSDNIPYFTSTHILESYSDIEQPMDICATGLTIFPREQKEEVQQTTASSTHTTNLTVTSLMSATQTTNTNCDINNINDISNNGSGLTSIPRATSSPQPLAEPRTESEPQTDFDKQKEAMLLNHLQTGKPDASEGAGGNLLLSKRSRMRFMSYSGSSSDEASETTKRLKKTTDDNDHPPCMLQMRSKSMYQFDPTSSNAKTPKRRRSVAANKLLATDPFYRLPFEHGWKRELVLPSNLNNARQQADVIFISPGGKKLRSRDDIVPLLVPGLSIDHFCFKPQLQNAGEHYETVRQGQSAKECRRLLAAAKQQKQQGQGQQQKPQGQQQKQQEQQKPQQQQQQVTNSIDLGKQATSTLTPVFGKRVPKPKVPKGASPPPEGWTPTTAVKGNARVLAASNGNSSGGIGSSAGNSARRRGNQTNKSAKTAPEPTTVVQPKLPLQPQSAVKTIITCAKCLQAINGRNQAYRVGLSAVESYICKRCVKPGSKASLSPPADIARQQQPRGPEHTNANGNDGNNKLDKEMIDENVNAAGNWVIVENIAQHNNLPHAKLRDDSPALRCGRKITPKPMEVVVINGRKAVAVAVSPPRTRPQIPLFTGNQNVDINLRSLARRNAAAARDKLKQVVDFISSSSMGCQLMTAVMKTLDLHERVRLSSVCKTWAMIGRDRSVWRTVKLRDTHISNWMLLLRDMTIYRTVELDMMGVRFDNPKMRFDGDLRLLKSLRILRTDASEAKFVETIVKCMPQLLELRTTCVSRALNLANIETMLDLCVLRIRMLEPKASIISLPPLQKLSCLRELSLRGISNMAKLELLQLEGLQQLETLVLGSCRGMKVAAFGQQVLPSLKRLRHLRLENHNSNRSFHIKEIMDGIAAAGTVKRVELINVNVDAELSRQLSECKSLQELLLLPNFHNHTAYMVHYIMQAINENSEQLNVFRLGITYELLSVTRALGMIHKKDCVPVLLPIPGVPENDVLNESDEPIAYLPVDRLESILHHMMPQGWLTVAKVSQLETINLKFLAAPSTNKGGFSNT